MPDRHARPVARRRRLGGALCAALLLTAGACAADGTPRQEVQAAGRAEDDEPAVGPDGSAAPPTTIPTGPPTEIETAPTTAPPNPNTTTTTTTPAPWTTMTTHRRAGPPFATCHPGTSAPLPSADHDIAFYRAGVGLLTVRPDGTGERRISDFGPASWWSPDGEHLVYQGENPEAAVMNADGTGARELATKGILEVAWAPDGQTLAATVARPDGYRDVVILDRDGEAIRRITDERLIPVALSWSPDGSVVSFSLSGQQLAMYLAPADGAPWTMTASTFGASWSPDGCWLAAVSPTGVIIMRPGGPERRTLITGSFQSAKWSPTGDAIAVESVAGDGITLLEGEDFTPRRIYDGVAFKVQWSPTGQHLAFHGPAAPGASSGGTDQDVWVIGRDGTGLVNVSRDPADDSHPAW